MNGHNPTHNPGPNPGHVPTPNPRRRTRNRLWLIGIVPSLLLLLFAGKVTLMLSAQASGDSSYGSEDFGAAADSFAGNRTLNLLEGWVAPFNEGTARHRLEDYDRAIDRFEEALPQAPDDEECTVRINLSLSHEARGDLAVEDDGELAVQEWTTAREVLAEGGCPTDAPGGEEQTEDAATIDERLRQKLEEQEQPEEKKEQEKEQKSEKEKQQQEKKKQELKKRNRQGVERHKDSREIEEYRHRDYDGGSHW